MRPLTAREEQILKLVEAGRRSKFIAEECGISKQTVKKHLANIRVKLDADPEIRTSCLRRTETA